MPPLTRPRARSSVISRPQAFTEDTGRSSRPPAWPGYAARAVLGVTAYYLLTRLGSGISGMSALANPAAAALAYALLLRWGARWWPVVAVGALLSGWGFAPVTLLGVVAARTIESVLGAWLFTRLAGGRSLRRTRDVVVLAGPVAVGASLVGAFLDTLVQLGVGADPVPGLESGAAWWVGDAVGTIALTPVVLLVLRPRPPGVPRPATRAVVELSLCLLFAVAVAAGIFFGGPPFPYLLFPVVIWAALQFGADGGALIAAGVGLVATWGTNAGLGPFGRPGVVDPLEGLAIFVGVMALTSLLLGAVIGDRDRTNADNEQLVSDLAHNVAELTQANRDLESFTYSVSHDLRAPLRNIDGFSRQLRKHYGDGLDERGHHYLERIRVNVTSMGNLIDEMLKISRLQRVPLHPRNVPMRKAVDVALQQLEAAVAERRPELVIGELPLVRGDGTLLTQVYANLLSNALKFTRESSPARIEVGVEKDEHGDWVFYVADNGAGFDMKYADKLFGVFQRLHKREDFEGSGVGLAIVARIVSRHRGRAWATSEVGVGTTVFFTLGDPDADHA